MRTTQCENNESALPRITTAIIAALAMAGAFAVFALYVSSGAHPPILKGSWCQTGADEAMTYFRRCYQPVGDGVIRITADDLITAERQCDAIGRTGWRMRYRCSDGAIEQWLFRLNLNGLTARVEDRSWANVC
jgi:hypothetical protein